jgi:cbb3-type cytochrome oxidase maturation protein
MIFMKMFMVYLSLGVAVTVAFFVWAVRNDQFRDQKRAGWLPLDDVTPEPRPRDAKWPGAMILTAFLAGLGLASAAVAAAVVIIAS